MGVTYCVVVPMFNEAANAERCVRAMQEAVTLTSPRGRLLVVEDGSADATAEILEGLRSEFPEMILERHPRNRGYGAAIRTAIAAAERERFDYALFTDADLTQDPRYFADFVARMEEGIDFIKATRYSLGGRMEGVPACRAALSRAGNWLAKRLFRVPISDCTNGFRAVRVPLLARLPLKEDGFPILMEELYYVRGLVSSWAEVPYTLTSRGVGQGVSRSVPYKIMLPYLRYAVRGFFRTPAPTSWSAS